MTIPSFRALALMSVLLLASCSAGDAGTQRSAAGDASVSWSPGTVSRVQGIRVAELRKAIIARLAGPRPAVLSDEAWRHTRRLYDYYQQSPLWLNEEGLVKDRAAALTTAVLNVNADAIALDDYPVADVAIALATLRQSLTPTADQLAASDVLLTATFAALGEDLLRGQVDPSTVSSSWHIDARDENVDSALARTIGKTPLDKAINAMRPPDAEYLALQKDLIHFRELASRGDWPRVPAGTAVRAGDADAPARLTALRARLAAEGYAVSAPATAGAVYDAALAGAVALFQARHGIAVDSALGPETVNSLNVPVGYRLGQIAANMERRRWMPRSLPERYVYVNVPAFQLQAFDAGKAVLEMKVIVGEEFEDTATPVFADSMETVVFRPYWNITPDIQRKEIGPKAAADPGYLAANDMEYYSDGGTRRIRQRPGPKNSLGYVKFLFPNDFNIYLHDTPNHELFDKDVRAFSHGCIRVEKPNELAQWALGWDAAKVRHAMEQGPDNTPVTLPRKIPVFISYGTTYHRDGQLYFGNDLYHRDDNLVKAIAEGALPSARAIEALQALRRIAGN